MLHRLLALLAVASLGMAAVVDTSTKDLNALQVRSGDWFQGYLWGGTGGTKFDDKDGVKIQNSKIKTITLRGAKRVDAISYTLENKMEFKHGGQGGTAVTHTLENGETTS